jgi:hypothetical protein
MDQNISDNDENALDINLDYMRALYLFLQTEYNLTSLVSTIRHLYNFLKDLNLNHDLIKDAINLLYNEVDPSKLTEVNHILNRLLTTANYTTNLSNLFTAFNYNYQNTLNNLDSYTGDIINPGAVLANMNEYIFQNTQNNINNLNALTNITYTIPHNYNIIFDTHNWFTLTYNNIQPTLINNNIIRNANGKETLSQLSLDKLTLVNFKNVDSEIKKKFETCLICLDDFKDETVIRTIKCTHLFHKDCIDSWLLKESYKCPLCRDSVIEEDNNDENLNDPYDADDEEHHLDADDEEHHLDADDEEHHLVADEEEDNNLNPNDENNGS